MEKEKQTTKYAVVTGAGKGIGRAIAKALANNGYTVIVCARTTADLVLLQDQTPHIIPFTADLATPDGVSALVEFITANYPVPDVIVNNVGSYRLDNMLQPDTDAFNAMMQVNYWAGFRLTTPFLNAMRERGSGHIFNICSMASIEAKDYAASYSITKHAQLGFSRNLANDLKQTGVKVTAILPGNVDTPSWDGYEGDRSNFLQPEAIAKVVIEELAAGTSREIILKN